MYAEPHSLMEQHANAVGRLSQKDDPGHEKTINEACDGLCP